MTREDFRRALKRAFSETHGVEDETDSEDRAVYKLEAEYGDGDDLCEIFVSSRRSKNQRQCWLTASCDYYFRDSDREPTLHWYRDFARSHFSEYARELADNIRTNKIVITVESECFENDY